LRVYARPLFDDAGQMTHVVEAFTDITREVVSRELQLEREAQLRQAQRMDSLGSLAGGIAHDFNNLLTIIKMIATDLSERSDSPEIQNGLVQIDEVTESATGLTRALLGFARQGKNLQQRTCLNEIAARVAEMARRTVGRHLTVQCELSSGPLAVEGDHSQLEQLLMNLVLNGRDAIAGSGTLTIRTSKQDVRERERGTLAPGPYAVVEVEDNGSGIPPEVRDRIFEPYFTTKTGGAVKGTGLGLATVFGIVENHRGSVSIARTGPGGTTMRVLLPLLQEEGDSNEVFTAGPKQADLPGIGTVLIVDDEPLVLRVTASALEARGYRVLKAPDGAQAIELFSKNHVDAVVLDLVMPVMGGRETFIKLRELDPAVRVLLITGFGLNYEAQELLDLGIVTFVAKPFSINELATALTHVIHHSRAGAAVMPLTSS
jgi:signal transduction histidine kinase/ActR/RegA family two-component response regulator